MDQLELVILSCDALDVNDTHHVAPLFYVVDSL